MRTLLTLILGLWLVAGLSAYGLFRGVPYAELATLLRQPNYAAEYAPVAPVLTPTHYMGLQKGSLLLAAVAALGLVGVLCKRSRRQARRQKLVWTSYALLFGLCRCWRNACLCPVGHCCRACFFLRATDHGH